MSNKIPGTLFSTLIGGIAFVSAPYLPMINSIVLALLMGILLSNFVKIPSILKHGISFSSKYLLETAIVFMGFGMSFQDISTLGWHVVITLIITISLVLISTFYLSKLFTCRTTTGYLVGFGTAICGSSAIAALAPKISKNKNDAGIAIAVVNLFGLVGMVAFPILFREDMLYDTAALLIGGTLHGVSNVAGAGYAMNEVVGDIAITIKLGRVALLAPSLIIFNFMINRSTSFRENIKLPYYIVGFIIATASVTFIEITPYIIDLFRLIGKILLTISMAAIGLNIRFAHLYSEGKVALGFGAVIFMIQISIVGSIAWLL